MRPIRATLAVLLFSATLCGGISAGAPSRATADWVIANGRKMDGRAHSLQVVAVQPGAVLEEAQWFSVFTYDGYGNGSWIQALVPLAKSDAFLYKYGSSVPTYMGDWVKNKRLDCVIRTKEDGTPYVEVDGALSVILEARRQREAKPNAEASTNRTRTWTHKDGRTIEAEFLSATATHVTFRRTSDGQVFTFPLDQLSQADRDYVSTQL